MTSLPVGSLGLGVDAGLTAPIARALAERAAELGYASLWSNDDPTAPGLETLAQFALGAPDLELGVGVLPLDRFPPDRIAAELDRLGFDVSKLWIGIGSGRLSSPLAAVRDAVAELRARVPGARIMVGGMRPQMCRLGGRLADGVLINWMVPAYAAEARGWVREGADEAGRPPPVTAHYVRVAVGPDAAERLREEEGRYRRFTAAHFAAMDAPVGSVGVADSSRPRVAEALDAHRRAVDLAIVRVLAGRDLDSLVAVAEAAAPSQAQ